MNPIDALDQDWRMYYHGTWMEHKTHGPCQIHVSTETSPYTFRAILANKTIEVRHTDLSLWFPETGAYNTNVGAFFLCRRAQRHMRKSAYYPDTYYSGWGYAPTSKKVLSSILLKEYYTLNECIKEFNRPNGKKYTMALNRALVLSKFDGPKLLVVYKCYEIGILNTITKTMELYSSCPFPAKRITQKLKQEGIKCSI